MGAKVGLVMWSFGAGWVAHIIIDAPPLNPSLFYLDAVLWFILVVDIVQIIRYYHAIK